MIFPYEPRRRRYRQSMVNRYLLKLGQQPNSPSSTKHALSLKQRMRLLEAQTRRKRGTTLLNSFCFKKRCIKRNKEQCNEAKGEVAVQPSCSMACDGILNAASFAQKFRCCWLSSLAARVALCTVLWCCSLRLTVTA